MFSKFLYGTLVPLLVPMDIPNPDPKAPPGFEAPVTAVMSWFKWGGLILLVLALVGVGATMWRDRRGDTDYMEKLGKIFIGAIIISAAVALIGFFAGG